MVLPSINLEKHASLTINRHFFFVEKVKTCGALPTAAVLLFIPCSMLFFNWSILQQHHLCLGLWDQGLRPKDHFMKLYLVWKFFLIVLDVHLSWQAAFAGSSA